MNSTTNSLVIVALILTGLALSTAAQERESGVRVYNSDITGWSNQGVNIDELRNSSNESFDLLDADSNGRVTLNEIDFDFDSMSEDEARELRRRANLAREKFMKWNEEIDRFDIGDTNQDGVLDRDEHDDIEKNVRTHRLQLGLSRLDADKNGSVDRQEFSAHLNELEEMDADGDGFLSRKEISKSDNPSVIRDAFHETFRQFGRDSAVMEAAVVEERVMIRIDRKRHQDKSDSEDE